MLPPSAIIQKGGFSMTEHEKYQEHIRHTHDAFCKTVIRHAAIDAARSIRSRRKREISLEYLIEEKHYPFSTTDKYFTEQSGMNSYPLFVCARWCFWKVQSLPQPCPHYHRWNRKSFSYTTSNDGRIERLGRDMDGQATQPGGGFR